MWAEKLVQPAWEDFEIWEWCRVFQALKKRSVGGCTFFVPVEFDSYHELEYMYKNKIAKNYI